MKSLIIIFLVLSFQGYSQEVDTLNTPFKTDTLHISYVEWVTDDMSVDTFPAIFLITPNAWDESNNSLELKVIRGYVEYTRYGLQIAQWIYLDDKKKRIPASTIIWQAQN